MNENPFNFTKPVKGEAFYNRKEELESIIGFIKGMNNLSIVGERRIGKTSVLEHVLSEELLRGYDIDTNNYIIVQFSLAKFLEITKETFAEAIVKELEELIQIEKESADTLNSLTVLIEKLTSGGKKIVLALDEFELVTRIPDDSFFHWLRNVLQKPNIMAITASRTTIRAFSDGESASPLYNIFGNVTLGLFPEEETREMIVKMFQKGGMQLDDKEISLLADLSGGNPYLIQFIGYHYYREREKSERVIPDNFENLILSQLNDVFEGYWNHLNEKEKKFLSDIENAKSRFIGYYLQRRGFLTGEPEELRIFSPILEKFVKNKKKENFQTDEESGITPDKGTEKWRKLPRRLLFLSGILIVVFLLFLLYKEGCITAIETVIGSVITAAIFTLVSLLVRELGFEIRR